MTSLTIVIPALDEEESIGAILRRVLAARDGLQEAGIASLEVIVVDDGSTDRTAEVAAGIDGVRVVRHERNRGYGAALKTGLGQARGDLLGFLDADGTYPPEHLPQLCRAALAGADVVIGSRMAGADSEMPLTRFLGNRLFALLVSLLSDQRVRDSASGMRILRREALARLHPLPDGLNFTPIMSVRALHEGLAVSEVPIPYSERVGRSKLSVVRDGLRFAESIVWSVLSYNPARVLGILGLGGVGAAMLMGLALIAVRAGGTTVLGPWGVAGIFAALVSGVAGVSLFNLAVTINYLVALFRRRTVSAGIFGKPLFDPPLDRHFAWMGSALAAAGVVIACVAIGLGVRGWPPERLWLYLVGAALFILVGLQLVISWLVMRVLEELAEREPKAETRAP
jgi:glycosyltransferase involved in cell wall biosynthesis